MTRVRFAPAPTGFLHIGGARTCISNWLYARNEGAGDLLRKPGAPLESPQDYSEENVEKEVRDFSVENNVKPGLIINGSRAALTGHSGGPSAFAIFAVPGKERAVERLRSV